MKLNIPDGIYYDPKCNYHKNIGIINKNTNFIQVLALTEGERKQIKPLIIDSLNTYQQCSTLPSEFLRQNMEIREALKEVQEMYEYDLHYRDEPFGMGYYSALSQVIEIFEKSLTSLNKGKE